VASLKCTRRRVKDKIETQIRSYSSQLLSPCSPPKASVVYLIGPLQCYNLLHGSPFTLHSDAKFTARLESLTLSSNSLPRPCPIWLPNNKQRRTRETGKKLSEFRTFLLYLRFKAESEQLLSIACAKFMTDNCQMFGWRSEPCHCCRRSLQPHS